MKTTMPEPVAARVWIRKTHDYELEHLYSEAGDGDPLFTEAQLSAAMVAAYNEAMEDAASAFDPLGEWLGIDEKAYLFAVGIARCIRELKKETP